MQQGVLNIRKMIRADISGVHHIEKQSFRDPWEEKTIDEAISVFPDTIFIAELSGIVCGYIICGIEDTGEEMYGHICSLAVGPEFRHKGAGSSLVRRAEHAVMLSGGTAMQLEVRVSNQMAQEFYRKLGYEPVFHICGYYADTEDAIVMMRWFRY